MQAHHSIVGGLQRRQSFVLNRRLPIFVALLAWLLSGCGFGSERVATPHGAQAHAPELAASEMAASESVALGDEVQQTLASAAPWLIYAERNAVGDGDLAKLAALWAEDAWVEDRRGAIDPERSYVWQGRAALLNRYVVAVFPHRPPPLEPDALDSLPASVMAEGDPSPLRDDAHPQEGAVFAVENGTDRWRLVWREGRWWLLSLSYTSQ